MSRRLRRVAAALAAARGRCPGQRAAPAATTNRHLGRRTDAIVSGTVDTRRHAHDLGIEYGTTSAYGSRSDTRSAGIGTSPVDGLAASSRGSRPASPTTTGSSRPTRTGRAAARADVHHARRARGRSGAAALIGPDAANLGGTVDPNGRTTGWSIEYGSTTATATAPRRARPVQRRRSRLRRASRPHPRAHVPLPPRRRERHRDDRRRGRSASSPTAPRRRHDGRADSITATSARLSGRVDPRGRGRSAWSSTHVDGLGTEPVTSTPASRRRLDPAATISGLQPGTTYHYRIAARATRARRTGGPGLPDERRAARRRPALARRSPGPPSRSPGPSTQRPRDDLLVRARPTTAYGTPNGREQSARAGARHVSETLTGLAPAPSTTSASSPRTPAARPAARTSSSDGRPPDRRARSASGLSLARALIRVDVASGGLETQVWVEFGRGGALTARTSAVGFRRRATTPVSFRLTGLAPGRRYGFRVVAASAAGTTTGATRRSGLPPGRAMTTAAPFGARSSGRTGRTGSSGPAARRDLRSRRRRPADRPRPGRRARRWHRHRLPPAGRPRPRALRRRQRLRRGARRRSGRHARRPRARPRAARPAAGRRPVALASRGSSPGTRLVRIPPRGSRGRQLERLRTRASPTSTPTLQRCSGGSSIASATRSS